MNLEITDLNDHILQFKLVGRMDMKGTLEIDNEFVLKATTSGLPILVDMSEVEFLASMGMRTLISAARGANNKGNRMILLRPQPLVKGALEVAGLAQLIPIYDDFDIACQQLKS